MKNLQHFFTIPRYERNVRLRASRGNDNMDMERKSHKVNILNNAS